MKLSPQEINELIEYGREQAGVEFKQAGDQRTLRGRVVRAMLAMANRRDGGRVLVGIRETGPELVLDGLTREQQTTWKHDDLADTVSNYADPRVAFDSYTVDVDGHTVLIIDVQEFSDVPVVCKKDLHEQATALLRAGAVYVRSNRKPESREVANHDEMRELLDIATDKGVRRFVARAQASGLDIAKADVKPKDAFRAERGDL